MVLDAIEALSDQTGDICKADFPVKEFLNRHLVCRVSDAGSRSSGIEGVVSYAESLKLVAVRLIKI